MLPDNSSPASDIVKADQIWAEAKLRLAGSLSEDYYQAWIARLNPVELKAGVLSLSGPNNFFLSWVKHNLAEAINQAVAEASHDLGQPDLAAAFEPPASAPALEASPEPKIPASEAPEPKTTQPAAKTHAQARAGTARPLRGLELELPYPGRRVQQPLQFNPRFTFDNFVVGDPSLYAYSAAKALAADQALGSEALFFVADHGLGKSHLSQALSQEILAHDHGRRIYYLTAEDFTNELVYSIKSQKMETFKEKYRHGCDVLVLEDVHFLAGKEKVQQELGFTLDYLLDRGRKIIMTAPQPPAEIPRLGKALRSRLSTALLSPIGAPDYQTRLKILWKKAAELKLAVPGNVLELMAERLTADVRCLESGLVSLAAKSRLTSRALNLALAREAISSLDHPDSAALTPAAIKALICRYFQLTPEELVSRSRRKHLLTARSMGIYLCRRLTVHTLEEIGQSFGRKHSTALYAINQFEQRLKKDSKLQSQFEFLSRQVADKL